MNKQIVTKESLAEFIKQKSKTKFFDRFEGERFSFTNDELIHLSQEILSIIQLHTKGKINTIA